MQIMNSSTDGPISDGVTGSEGGGGKLIRVGVDVDILIIEDFPNPPPLAVKQISMATRAVLVADG